LLLFFLLIFQLYVLLSSSSGDPKCDPIIYTNLDTNLLTNIHGPAFESPQFIYPTVDRTVESAVLAAEL